MKTNRLFFVTLLTFLALNTFSQDLLIHLPFDETEGVTSFDATSNENDGTFVGAPKWIEGHIGNAISFDGLVDYDSIPGSESITFSPTDYFTIATWFRLTAENPKSLYGSGGRVAAKAHAGILPDEWSWQLKFGPGAPHFLGFELRTNINDQVWVDVGHYLTINEWYFIALTYDGDDAICHLNGVPTDTIPMPEGLTDYESLPLLIGADGWHKDFPLACFFAGDVDEFRMYDDVLDEDQLFALFESTGVKNSELALESDITIYPNPAKEMTRVGIENEWRGMVTYKLFDYSGRIINTKEVEKIADRLEINVDMTDLNSGAYIFNVSFDGIQVNKKVNKF